MIAGEINPQSATLIIILSVIGTILGLTVFSVLKRMKQWVITISKRGADRAVSWWYTETEIGKIQREAYEHHGRIAEIGLFIAFPGFMIPTFVLGVPDMMYSMIVLRVEQPILPVGAIYAGAYTFMGGLAIAAAGVAKSEFPNYISST